MRTDPYDRGKDSRDRIEQLLDTHGIRPFLEMLSVVCSEKAEHVAANWQDPRTAKLWQRWAERFDRDAACKLDDPYA